MVKEPKHYICPSELHTDKTIKQGISPVRTKVRTSNIGYIPPCFYPYPPSLSLPLEQCCFNPVKTLGAFTYSGLNIASGGEGEMQLFNTNRNEC